jgi:hypothetical protein
MSLHKKRGGRGMNFSSKGVSSRRKKLPGMLKLNFPTCILSAKSTLMTDPWSFCAQSGSEFHLYADPDPQRW